MNSAELKAYVETNPRLVKINNSEEFPELTVLKYAKTVFFKGNWDTTLMQLRGTTVDANYQLKGLPFTKTFNRLELPHWDFQRDDKVIAVRKVNGFMASVTYVPELGQPIVCTTGSVDSAFCGYARHVLPDEAMFYITKEGFEAAEKNLLQKTHVFEIVHPEDPHVVPEHVGAYYLGNRPVSFEEFSVPTNRQNAKFQAQYDEIAKEMSVFRPAWYEGRYSDFTRRIETCKDEGFMIWKDDDETSMSIKLKSPYYSITKYMGRRRDTSFDNIGISVPPGLKTHEALTFRTEGYIVDHFSKFSSLDEQGRFKFVREFLDEQKVYNQ